MKFTTKNPIRYSHQNGFTLIELSIVLVIVALLAGGVVAGQALIRAATIRSQVAQILNYQTAFMTFYNKYNCYAGDCADGSEWFDVDDGDGDKLVELEFSRGYDYDGGFGPTGYASWLNSPEAQYALISLSEAGLVADIFDDTRMEPGRGMVAAKYNKQKGFFISDSSNFNIVGATPNPNAYRRGNNALWFVNCRGLSTAIIAYQDDGCGSFIPVDLKDIDTKIDDGRPLSGKMFGFSGGFGGISCVNGTEYQLTRTDPTCNAAYVIN